jgi:cell wall-associated NlpC family hydrolase
MARTPRRLLRPFPIVVAVSASLVTALLGAPPSAQARSGSSLKDQIAQARQQLQALDSQAEAASERYDAARIQLVAAHASATRADAALAAARQRLGTMQAAAANFALAAYQGGGQTSALGLLSDGSAGRYVAQLSSLQAVSVSEASTLSDVAAAQRAEEGAQATAHAALARQQSATTALSAARSQILAAAAKEKSLLSGLEAREAAIVRAAKAAAARLAAQQEEARLRAAELATEQAAAAISQPVSSVAPPVVSGSGGAAVAVQWAYREIGKPYQWAAAGPDSFDCSGLTQYVWGKAGVYLGHYTGDQWNEGVHVSRDQLEPGDLVFFAYDTSDASTIHHVGIYVGGGDMIDAPYTGAYVRKEPAFRSDYIGAVRPG